MFSKLKMQYIFKMIIFILKQINQIMNFNLKIVQSNINNKINNNNIKHIPNKNLRNTDLIKYNKIMLLMIITN